MEVVYKASDHLMLLLEQIERDTLTAVEKVGLLMEVRCLQEQARKLEAHLMKVYDDETN
jgi:HJR/Mrr/RecB family endonuclease